MVHADTASTGRLRFERFGKVALKVGGKHRSDVAVRLLQVDAADLAVGDSIDEDLVVVRDLFDRVEYGPRRLVEEGQRIKQIRCGLLADVVGHRRQQCVL